jgi:hypothetical protein
MAKPGTKEFDDAMQSFARFLAAQIVREWRDETRDQRNTDRLTCRPPVTKLRRPKSPR